MRPRHWLILALAVALAAGGLMTLHTVRHAIRVRRAAEPLRPWMSIPYIARSHHVRIEILYQEAGLPVDRRDHRPLSRIAHQQERPVDELIARLETAIARSRIHSPPRTDGGAP